MRTAWRVTGGSAPAGVEASEEHSDYCHAVDRWGTYPDWLAAIGTVGAFAIGFGVLLLDVRARREESRARLEDAQARAAETERRAADTERLRRHQASRVSGLLETTTPFGQEPRTFAAVVHNASDQPIYDVEFRFFLVNGGSRQAFYANAVLPGAALRGDLTDLTSEHVLPMLELTFKDSNGVKWQRNGEGDLHEGWRRAK